MRLLGYLLSVVAVLGVGVAALHYGAKAADKAVYECHEKVCPMPPMNEVRVLH